jgi:hypothetical protein
MCVYVHACVPTFLTERKFDFLHHLKVTVQVASIATSANILPFYLAEASTRYSKSLGVALAHC